MMRKARGLVILLILLLAACAETPQPTATTVSRAGDLPAPPAASPAASTLAPPPSPPPEVQPTALPAADVAPTDAPVETDSPWPAHLREIDLGIPAGNSYNPRVLAIHAGKGRLYARTTTQSPSGSGMGSVAVLDLADGRVLAVVETGSDRYSEGELIVDPALDRVYATNPGDATCSVLDGETLEQVAVLDDVERLALDAEGARLYIASPSGRRQLDATTYETLVEATFPPGWQILGLELDPSADRLYLAGRDSSGYLLSLYEASTLNPISTTPLPGRPDDILAAPGWKRVFVSLDDGQQSYLWILDGGGRVLERWAMGEWTQEIHLALDPGGERLFLGRDSYGDHGISILDLASGEQIAGLPLSVGPKALAWDGGSGRLLFSDTYAQRIYRVDVEAGQVSGFFPTAIGLDDLEVDPGRGHVYITDTSGQLHVLDSDSDQELAILPAEGYIALDAAHGRLYTGGGGADRVRILNTDSMQQIGEIRTEAKPVADAYHGGLYLVRSGIYLASLETMTITGVISDTLPQNPGFSPNPAAVDAVVDPGSGRIFAVINNGVPGSNSGNYLHVYEPETYRKVFSDTERSPIYLDVDPATGQAYVSRVHMTQRSTSLLANGREYSARLDSVFGALRVDQGLGKVYLSVAKEPPDLMMVLDARNLDVLGTVPISGTLLALDPQRHLLYLATDQGRVEIWSATGGTLPPADAPIPVALSSEEIDERYQAPSGGPLFVRDRDYRLYRSDDGGGSWQRIRGGLPDEWVLALAFSANFAQDQTLFAALATADQGFGVWKSTDGGTSWQMASRGLTDLAVTSLSPSPNYVNDGTLFAVARRGGLYRSTDQGLTWTSLTGRYRPEGASTQEAGPILFSPAYSRDHTLFVNHYGLQRSADGGETWSRVFAHTVRPLVFSPELTTDHTLFGWTSYGGLLRSTDGGATWTAASSGMNVSSYGSGQVMVSPDYSTSQTLYFVWSSSAPGTPARFFRSTDGAMTWQRLAGESPPVSTTIELVEDGSAFVTTDGGGNVRRWPLAGMEWRADERLADETPIHHLVLPPDPAPNQFLYAQSEGAGVLRAPGGLEDTASGLRWTDSGFPVRILYGDPPEIVFVSPDTLFAGTTLGVYRSTANGPWTLLGGGLPRGVATTSPSLGVDNSLRVLAGGRQIYLSTDGGQTWTQPVPDLPHDVNRLDLHLSPAFATDHTAFIAQPWKKPQRTVGGGAWERFGPPGEWTVSALQLSPEYDQDGLLLMRLDDHSLWRSVDQGETWIEASGPWGDTIPLDLTLEPGYSQSAVTFSPDYGRDGVMLTRAGNAIYRSMDGGATWTRILDVEASPIHVVFTPGYARDSTAYLVQGRTLYRSGDRGESWERLCQGPWAGNEEVHLQPSPIFAQDKTLLAWTPTGQVYQSSNGGSLWQDASRGLPGGGIRQILFTPSFAVNGLVYLVPTDPGLYRRVGEGPWVPASQGILPPTLPPTPTPPPPPTPTTPACPTEPTLFRQVWQQAHARLGCPDQPATQIALGEQFFEQGRMIWDSSNLQIYVLLSTGGWQAFDDTWSSDQPALDPALVPPEGRFQPQRGFGKVWREQLGGPQAAIGWALEGERGVNGWRQRFEKGTLVWTDAHLEGASHAGTAVLLYDDGTWQAIPAPAP